MREYLYVDDRRLNAYVEQISPPITYDKVPVWRTEVGIIGPKAGATQERRARTLTRHEKVEALLNHLIASKVLHSSRPRLSDRHRLSERHDEPLSEFVLETFMAVRIEIPANVQPEPAGKSLALWVSHPAETKNTDESASGILCLLEDFHYSDKTPFNGYDNSAFSLLWSLAWSLRNEISDLVIGKEFPRVSGGDDSWENRIDVWHGSKHHMEDFIANPIASLESWGCIAGPLRSVRSLYRIREYGPEQGDLRKSVSIFGYPIVIMSAMQPRE